MYNPDISLRTGEKLIENIVDFSENSKVEEENDDEVIIGTRYVSDCGLVAKKARKKQARKKQARKTNVDKKSLKKL